MLRSVTFFVVSTLLWVSLPRSPALAQTDLSITAEITGIERRSIRNELLERTQLWADSGGFSSQAAVTRMADRDAADLTTILVARGYYAATVRPEIARQGRDVTVTFVVDQGPLFEIGTHRIDYLDEGEQGRPLTFADAKIRPKGEATGDALRALELRFLGHLLRNGFPLAKAGNRRVEANFTDVTATAVFEFTSGPKAAFGDISVSGARFTRPKFIERLRTFQPGDTYDRTKIDSYRTALGETGLFNRVEITTSAVQPDGTAPVEVVVGERKHRTVGFGVSFATDVGPGGTASWQNRNFFGGGETGTFDISIAELRQEARGGFTRPMPRWPGSISASAGVANEESDAFSALTYTIGGGTQRYAFDQKVDLNANIDYTYSDITDSDGTSDIFQSISFPLAAVIDTSDDPLNPGRGFRLRVGVTPFLGTDSFTTSQVGFATRGRRGRAMLAGRTLIGGTLGTVRSDLPATERYFAGGGGSVRGYAYQEAGAIDPDTGSPLGGASIVEFNIEARYNLTNNIQLAIFADTGTVYESASPSFDEDFQTGVGGGIRYITPIGPLRLDIAVPTERRRIFSTQSNEDGNFDETFTDDAFHLYIALGQPF